MMSEKQLKEIKEKYDLVININKNITHYVDPIMAPKIKAEMDCVQTVPGLIKETEECHKKIEDLTKSLFGFAKRAKKLEESLDKFYDFRKSLKDQLSYWSVGAPKGDPFMKGRIFATRFILDAYDLLFNKEDKDVPTETPNNSQERGSETLG